MLGGPGSGKSTLLRRIAMDLLAGSSSLPGISDAWGDSLPVWIPFAQWTTFVQNETGAGGLTDFLAFWLKTWSAADLVPLVEKALKDTRLLLLVDGLDEWTNREAAETAMSLIRPGGRQRTP